MLLITLFSACLMSWNAGDVRCRDGDIDPLKKVYELVVSIVQLHVLPLLYCRMLHICEASVGLSEEMKQKLK